MKKRSSTRRTGSSRPGPRGHHHVYVVFLRNPNGDGKAGYYVGMTGLSPEQRFENHKLGVKAARIVVADIDPARVERVVSEFAADAVAPAEIYGVPADIFA